MNTSRASSKIPLSAIAACLIACLMPLLSAPEAPAQDVAVRTNYGRRVAGECDYRDIAGVVWWGTEAEMTVERFAALAGPIYWFSPDEPLLRGTEGTEIMMPEHLPFEDSASAPVVYYQLDEIVSSAEDEQQRFFLNEGNRGQSVLDLEGIGLVRMSYFAYFPWETGLGAHEHDVEAAEFKIAIMRSDGAILPDLSDAVCEERNYVIVVTRVTGQAHGIQWFWNISDVDPETRMPFSLLIEEGKHAVGTDKNGDGYFTPTYDVNVAVNDAWGTRDVISSGGLVTGGYQAWMTKVRYPQHRVFPPLPEDSPLRARLARHWTASNWETENAVYELRPYPSAELGAYDRLLYRFMKSKEVEDWPEVSEKSDFQEFLDWAEEGTATRSLAISLLYDGALGFSWVFPFFVVKNLEVGISGGWIVHRMYLKDDGLRDFGWQLMYTNSASRWFDGYFGAGVEWDASRTAEDPNVWETKTDFVLETGFKFRANLEAIKWLSWWTPFWGARFGIKNYGFANIDKLTYVIEFGAGAF